MSLALGAAKILTYPGNTSQADDQKTDHGKLILSEEQHLPPYKPQGCGHFNVQAFFLSTQVVLQQEDASLVEFMYLVFARMPGGVTVNDSDLLLCPLSVERYKLPLFVYSACSSSTRN